MAFAKVVLNDETLIDLTQDTVAANNLYSTYTAHGANGVAITGTAAGSASLQSKTVTPTESQQNVTPDSGYTGLSKVTVNAISSSYVGSNIPRKSSADLTVSGSTITAPIGYYSAAAAKNVGAGTAGTPTATKGTVANNSVSVTPKVTNTTGYITGSTLTGTAVTVSASELVSGTLSITTNGTHTVTNYQSVNVNVGTSPTISALTVTPTTTSQTFNESSVDGYKPVTVNAVATMTLPTAAATTSTGTVKATIGRSTANQYINIPTGYNTASAFYTISSVPNGTAITPATTITTNPTITIASATGIVTGTYTGSSNVTPTVSAGYVATGTAGKITTTGTNTLQLTSKAAATIYTSTADQTIASYRWLTGTQTIKSVTTTNLSAANIISGVTIQVGDSNNASRIAAVAGTVVLQNYYSGTTTPASTLGSNGDLYLQS